MKKNLLATLLFIAFSAAAFAQLPTFEWRIENEQQLTSTTYSFDVNMYNTGIAAFEVKAGTFALLYNTAWVNGGTPTIAYTNNALSSGQQGGAASIVTTGAAYFRKVITSVGATLGTSIPANSKLRMFTVTVTNTVAFSTSATPNLAWKFNASPAAGFSYTDGSGNAVAVVANSGTAQVVANAAFCFQPAYWAGTSWNTGSQTAAAASTAVPTASQEAVVYSGTVAGSVTCRGYNLMATGTHTMTSSETLTVGTELTNNGGTFSSTGNIVFNGTARKQSTNVGLTANNITVNNNGLGLTLGGSTTANGILTLTSGNVTLGSNNLTLGNAATVSGGGSTSYVITDGAGALKINNLGTGGRTTSFTFPVGTTTSYNPVSFSNTSAASNFTVSVASGVSAIGAALTSNVVNRTWGISSTGGNSSLSNVTLQWNATEELTSFNTSNCYVANVDNTGRWIPNATAPSAANGSAFTQTLASVQLSPTFNSFGVGSNSSLPISLLTFTGAKRGISVELNWKTANEVNAKEFQVEKSENNRTFTQIGTVKAVGNTRTVSAYNYTDNDARTTQNVRYYRLKMVDMDGRYKYSNTISVTNRVIGVAVVVFPNPSATNKLTIMNCTATSYKVFNIAGEVVATGATTNNEVNIEKLASGVYMLSVVDDTNETSTVKFVKQ